MAQFEGYEKQSIDRMERLMDKLEYIVVVSDTVKHTETVNEVISYPDYSYDEDWHKLLRYQMVFTGKFMIKVYYTVDQLDISDPNSLARQVDVINVSSDKTYDSKNILQLKLKAGDLGVQGINEVEVEGRFGDIFALKFYNFGSPTGLYEGFRIDKIEVCYDDTDFNVVVPLDRGDDL